MSSRASRNKTLVLNAREKKKFLKELISLNSPVAASELLNHVIYQDIFETLPQLPERFVDLLIIDPPYNLDKQFNTLKFSKIPELDYQAWFESWFQPLLKVLKPEASIYVCCDWKTSTQIFNILQKHCTIRNRITWEREKGRGSKYNWKNCSEDIWFGTLRSNYTFNVDAVKIKRRVLAPYKDDEQRPKDWNKTKQGNFRLTCPSNLWTDISVPFWSMSENTPHPTQKPEKLIAKLILSSSNEGDCIFDPFLGSGTTAVVAQKLGRNFSGIEQDEDYCCMTLKRLEQAKEDATIQGYSKGVFWERNTSKYQKLRSNSDSKALAKSS